MYQITNTSGFVVGVTERVNYIKLNADGEYIPAAQLDAFGVAAQDAVGLIYRGIAYNLVGHDEIPDADTVTITEVDAGEVFEQYATYDALAAAYAEGVQNA